MCGLVFSMSDSSVDVIEGGYHQARRPIRKRAEALGMPISTIF